MNYAVVETNRKQMAPHPLLLPLLPLQEERRVESTTKAVHSLVNIRTTITSLLRRPPFSLFY